MRARTKQAGGGIVDPNGNGAANGYRSEGGGNKGNKQGSMFATIIAVLGLMLVIGYFGGGIAGDSNSSSSSSSVETNRATTGDAGDPSIATPVQQPVTGLKVDLIRDLKHPNAEQVWRTLVWEAMKLHEAGKNPGAIIEVGMHSGAQCFAAARKGLEVHCVEPSPVNVARVRSQLVKESDDVKALVHFYPMAAGDRSGGTVEFTSSGSTGDHVGSFDMWSMTKEEPKEEDKKNVVTVETITVDDIVDKTDKVFLLKVDTQGYEPAVFSGLDRALKSGKIRFILSEFWPKGMDFQMGKEGQCIATEILEKIAGAGYILYTLNVSHHPNGPKDIEAVVHERPLDNFRQYCQWLLDQEKRFPSENYKIGYWTDIVAVAPGSHINELYATTAVGKILRGTYNKDGGAK